MANNLEAGQTLLLENVRFHPEEEKNDRDFAKTLASLAEFYVNDAFGSAHRAHASTVGHYAVHQEVRSRSADGEGARLSRQGAGRPAAARSSRSSAAPRSGQD